MRASAVAGVLAAPAAIAAPARAAEPAASAAEFEDIVVDRGDAILAARAIGSGELILIHPSLGRGARDFDPLMRLLAAGGYRAASFDPRGIGQSTAPSSAEGGRTFTDYAEDMLAVMHALDEARAHVMGHALGNRITRMLATNHPEAVHTVTLCACGGGTPSPQAEVGLEMVTNPETPLPQFKEAVKSTFFAAASDPTPWYVGWYDIGAQAESFASAATSSSDYVAGGVAPMLIIQGLEDIVAPPSIGHDLKRAYGARVQLHDLPGCGHALIIEKTREIASIMLGYLGAPAVARPRVSVSFRSLVHRVPSVTVRTLGQPVPAVTAELIRGGRVIAAAELGGLRAQESRTGVLHSLRGHRLTPGPCTLLVRSGGRSLLWRKVRLR